jgi:hypothetical protein
MLLAMIVFVHVWFADIPTTWIPGLAVGWIVYLLWLYFQPALQQRKHERERLRQRRSHWGHD